MGLLVGLTGPSGSGKSTIINVLLAKHSSWQVVRSYTTRAPRANEDDVKRYFFVCEDEFRHLVQTGEIIEFEAYAGHLYGTSRRSLEETKARCSVVLFDLQVEGLRALKRQYPQLVDIGLVSPVHELQQRLAADAHRANVSAAEQRERLAQADRVNEVAAACTFVVESRQGAIDRAVRAVEQIIINALPQR